VRSPCQAGTSGTMRHALILVLPCLPTFTAHPDPSAKPTARLKLPRQYGDCLSCSIVASPEVLHGASAWVSLDITGVSFGFPSDWVGVVETSDLSPEGALLRYPLRYQSAARSCWPRPEAPALPNLTCAGEACCAPNNYTTTGSATLRFELINMRSELLFVLVQGSTQYPQIIAKTRPVTFASPGEPTQLHLARTADWHEMRVSWTSGNLSAPPAVRWGRRPGLFDQGSALASGLTYTREQLCERGGPARLLGWRDPGVQWTAVITRLSPGVRYYYTVGSDEDGAGWSHLRPDGSAANLSFVAASGDSASPSPPGTLATSVRLLAFGDLGKAPSAWDGSLEHSWDNNDYGELGSWNTTRLLRAELDEHHAQPSPPDAVLHIGDISYAVGFSAEWDEFLAQIEPVAARLPWMTTDGNHERNCPCMQVPPAALAAGMTWFNGSDSGGECGVPYESRFQMPTPSPDSPWYGMFVGPVAIVLMSTEHDFSQGSAQLTRLEQLLSGVDRARHPWLVFGGHRPMYVDQYGGYIEPASAPLQKLVEPLLLKYKVDMALWGHHHSYQRSCRLARGKCVDSSSSIGPELDRPWGIVHAVIGAAGYEFSRVAEPSNTPAWVRFANDTQYGYATLDANTSRLHFAFVRADGQGLLDEVTLEKEVDAHVIDSL
jgi:hypothetical protein